VSDAFANGIAWAALVAKGGAKGARSGPDSGRLIGAGSAARRVGSQSRCSVEAQIVRAARARCDFPRILAWLARRSSGSFCALAHSLLGCSQDAHGSASLGSRHRKT